MATPLMAEAPAPLVDPVTSDVTPAAVDGFAERCQTLRDRLRIPHYHHDHAPVRNANEVHEQGLSKLDRLAVAILDTDRESAEEVWARIYTASNKRHISLGAAVFDPGKPTGLEDLLDRAERDLEPTAMTAGAQ